jgi:hypothetical protein
MSKVKTFYIGRLNLTWESELIPAGRPAGEPVTENNEKIVVKTFIGTG